MKLIYLTTFLVFLLSMSHQSFAADDPILADLTCKLYGPTSDGYKTAVEVPIILRASDARKATRIGNQVDGCVADEFYSKEAISNDKKVEVAVIANVCGDSEVYWFGSLRSNYLFPINKKISYQFDPTDYNRVLLGSEESDEYYIEIDGNNYRFLYFDCQPTNI